jgi:hypothetical protein
MPGNLDVWDLWQSAATQWRASGFGLIGLDYQAVHLVAGLVGVTLTDAVLQKLQVLEGLTLMSQMETAKKATSTSSTKGSSRG